MLNLKTITSIINAIKNNYRLIYFVNPAAPDPTADWASRYGKDGDGARAGQAVQV